MNDLSCGCGLTQPFSLDQLGWTEEHTEAFSKYSGPYIPGRVACRQKTSWEVLTEIGPVMAGTTGALKKLGRSPAVGDFVVLLHQPDAGVSTIVAVLPQKTVFSRGIAGKDGTDQVIAANIDTVFIVTAAGPDLNARRLERYLAIVHAAGARPVIVINKVDLADDPVALVEEIAPVTAGVTVIPLSAISGEGMALLDPYLTAGTTISLVGSSGVGKSTLINRLLDMPVQETSQIRDADGRGRHTTTVRQLFVVKGGALMIDNPGLREVGIGTAGAGLAETFPDIIRLAAGCKFSDCRHENEPACAVREAVGKGTLPQVRLDNYCRLTKELAFEQEKSDIGLIRYERKRWKAIKAEARHMHHAKGRF